MHVVVVYMEFYFFGLSFHFLNSSVLTPVVGVFKVWLLSRMSVCCGYAREGTARACTRVTRNVNCKVFCVCSSLGNLEKCAYHAWIFFYFFWWYFVCFLKISLAFFKGPWLLLEKILFCLESFLALLLQLWGNKALVVSVAMVLKLAILLISKATNQPWHLCLPSLALGSVASNNYMFLLMNK